MFHCGWTVVTPSHNMTSQCLLTHGQNSLLTYKKYTFQTGSRGALCRRYCPENLIYTIKVNSQRSQQSHNGKAVNGKNILAHSMMSLLSSLMASVDPGYSHCRTACLTFATHTKKDNSEIAAAVHILCNSQQEEVNGMPTPY